MTDQRDARFVIVGAAALVIGVLRIATACGGAADSPLLASDGGSSDGSATPSGPRGPTGSVVADGGDRAPGSTAGPGGSTSSLPCGAASCVLPGEVCCSSEAGGGTFSFACVAGATCPNAAANPEKDSVTLACASAANCATGTVCCITGDGNVSSSSCKPSCTRDEAQLCDPKAATTGCAADAPCSSKSASDWGLPSTFGTCGGKEP